MRSGHAPGFSPAQWFDIRFYVRNRTPRDGGHARQAGSRRLRSKSRREVMVEGKRPLRALPILPQSLVSTSFSCQSGYSKPCLQHSKSLLNVVCDVPLPRVDITNLRAPAEFTAGTLILLPEAKNKDLIGSFPLRVHLRDPRPALSLPVDETRFGLRLYLKVNGAGIRGESRNTHASITLKRKTASRSFRSKAVWRGEQIDSVGTKVR